MGNRLEIELTPETAQRLILTADLAIRDEKQDARSQSLSLMSIAISLHRIAEHISVEDSAPALELKRLNPLLRKIANANKGVVMVNVDEVVTARDLLGLNSETDSDTGGLS